MIDLSEKDAIYLFRFLKQRETELDESIVPILTRIERLLYKTMSIEELETLSSDKESGEHEDI